MDEAQLQVFIDGTIHYFTQASEEPADVGTPYLIGEDQTIADEYTGIIGISGRVPCTLLRARVCSRCSS